MPARSRGLGNKWMQLSCKAVYAGSEMQLLFYVFCQRALLQAWTMEHRVARQRATVSLPLTRPQVTAHACFHQMSAPANATPTLCTRSPRMWITAPRKLMLPP